MKCLLDTNICIYIIKKKPEKVLRKFTAYSPGEVGISSVTLAELFFGTEKSQDPERNLSALEGFLIPLEIVSFDAKAAFQYGKIRSNLEKAGKPIGGMDLLIAAQALSLDIPLVTNNAKEFNRVQGLEVLNWV